EGDQHRQLSTYPKPASHHHPHQDSPYSPHSLPGWKTMFFVDSGHPQSQLHNSNVFLVIHHGTVHRYKKSNPKKSAGDHIFSLFLLGIRLRCVFRAQHHNAISSAEGLTVKTLPKELSERCRTAATHLCNDTPTGL
ncbi:hypothetical protein ILYODFUR_021814, partial [Ilyodon furcidens]